MISTTGLSRQATFVSARQPTLIDLIVWPFAKTQHDLT